MIFNLDGKSALVTGSSRGIGRAIAIALAQNGADVAVHYQHNETAARETAAQIETLGRRAPIFQADLRDMAQVKNLWTQAQSELGQIDILVNNAGILKSGFLAFTSDANWDEVLDVNLKSAFALCRLAAKSMSRHKSGRIINLSSRAGEMGSAMRAPYSAAKAGLIGLTKTAARELAAHNVTVNAIAPGFIATEMLSDDETQRETQRQLVPLKRFGTPDEVAALALYLASDEAAYVTGQVWGIDGGLRM